MARRGILIAGGAKSDREVAKKRKTRLRLAPCTGKAARLPLDKSVEGGAPHSSLKGQGEGREACCVSFIRCSQMVRFLGYPQYGFCFEYVISNDVTNVYTFSLLFGIHEILSKLGAKVKASPSSLGVFVTPDETANKSFLGDRLDHFCSLFESNGQGALELLETGRFTFNANSLMLVFFLLVHFEEILLLDSMGSKSINYPGGVANKIK